MRTSLLSRLFRTALSLIAFALPTALTPGLGRPPQAKPHRLGCQHEVNTASLSVGLIRHRATTWFQRFFDATRSRQATGWMVTT